MASATGIDPSSPPTSILLTLEPAWHDLPCVPTIAGSFADLTPVFHDDGASKNPCQILLTILTR